MTAIYPLGLPIALSLVAYNALLTGLLVLFKRRDKAGVHYLIFSLLVFVWGMGISFMLNNELPADTSQAWGTFSQISALFIPVAWLHFVLVYTEKLRYSKKILWAAYAVTLTIFPSTPSRWFVAGFREIVTLKQYPIPGPFYVAFTLLFATVVAYSFWILCAAWAEARTQETKTDFKLLFFAQLYGFVTGSLSFLPVYGIPFPQYNLLAMPLWQFLLAYAMVRYRLFDLEEIAHAAQRDKLAAIGTLATSINHEIRNPLYVIKLLAESYLENLREGIYKSKEEMVERSYEVLSKSVEQAERAMDIMKRFSLFAKDRTQQECKFEEVRLNEALEGVLPLVRYELELDKIELVKDIPGNLPAIKADRRHLEEIFFNLIVNACQAMENGGQLTIRAEQRNGTVRVEIKDGGPGIPPDQLPRVFEPFYTTKESGTGLGLYVTKQLVEKNKGRITVSSELNKGTRFTLMFPIGISG